MKNTKSALMITLFACMSKKAYTMVSADKQLELMKEKHRIKIKRRWLFKCLADLIEEGLITRRERFKNESDGKIHQLSSMFAFTIRGAKHLIANRVEGSLLLLKKIVAWMKNQDKRFPDKPALTGAVKVEMDPEAAGWLLDLAARIPKPI